MKSATSSAERSSIAKKRLEDCENKHEECINHALVFENDHKSYLLTRVIDLQGVADSASVRLEIRSHPEPTWGRYAALSHRWPMGPWLMGDHGGEPTSEDKQAFYIRSAIDHPRLHLHCRSIRY